MEAGRRQEVLHLKNPRDRNLKDPDGITDKFAEKDAGPCMKRIWSRRSFLGICMTAAGEFLFGRKDASATIQHHAKDPMTEPAATVFRAINGSPSENLQKVLEIAGGIDRFVGQEDVVVVKPNLQWWNQGAPNLSALIRFVEIVMQRPGGFNGEVVIAENCHRGPAPGDSMSAGWAHSFERNSDMPGISNANDMATWLKKKYGDRLTVRHWINVDAGGRRVYGPEGGEGYVYCDGTGGVPLIACDNGLAGEKARSTIMTYPVFRTDKGTTVDFRNGVWSKGKYTGQPLRFINFAAVNHHSLYCGMTSSIKNYLGITDLSGGPDPHEGGHLTPQYYNFHSFPYDKWAPGPRPGMLGKAVGTFLNTVRRADLNIATAEWVGLSSRIDPPLARTRAVLASKDPVALDYHAAKYILYANSRIRAHDPESGKSPLCGYLETTFRTAGGCLDERQVEVRSFDIEKSRFQRPDEYGIRGDILWGSDPKSLLKFMYMRYIG